MVRTVPLVMMVNTVRTDRKVTREITESQEYLVNRAEQERKALQEVMALLDSKVSVV